MKEAMRRNGANGSKSANRLQIICPACTRTVRGPSEDEMRARMVKHIRNCSALRVAQTRVVEATE